MLFEVTLVSLNGRKRKPVALFLKEKVIKYQFLSRSGESVCVCVCECLCVYVCMYRLSFVLWIYHQIRLSADRSRYAKNWVFAFRVGIYSIFAIVEDALVCVCVCPIAVVRSEDASVCLSCQGSLARVCVWAPRESTSFSCRDLWTHKTPFSASSKTL